MNQEQEQGKETFQQFVNKLTKPMGSWSADLLHAAVGLLGEVAELQQARSRANLIEELGDIEFYFERLLSLAETKWENFALDYSREVGDERGYRAGLLADVVSTPYYLFGWSANILDKAKKAWVYNKELDQLELTQAFAGFRIFLSRFYLLAGLFPGEAMQTCKQKLDIRYPNGYTDQSAQLRADKSEVTADNLQHSLNLGD